MYSESDTRRDPPKLSLLNTSFKPHLLSFTAESPETCSYEVTRRMHAEDAFSTLPSLRVVGNELEIGNELWMAKPQRA